MTETINIVTVKCSIGRMSLGYFLHLMESRAGVHIIDRVDVQRGIKSKSFSVLTLRTDEFPADWDMREVVAIFNKGADGVAFRPVGWAP